MGRDGQAAGLALAGIVGMAAAVQVGLDEASKAALRRAINGLTQTRPLMRSVASLAESSAVNRFRSQVGPDGKPWKPSIRAQLENKDTLRKSGVLLASHSSSATDTEAVVSNNRVYAGIHQFGGTIRQFLASGSVREIPMPARPFIGIDDDDRLEITRLVADFVSQAAR